VAPFETFQKTTPLPITNKVVVAFEKRILAVGINVATINAAASQNDSSNKRVHYP